MTVECRADIRCPVCRHNVAVCFDVVAGADIAQPQLVSCRECGEKLLIEATMNLSVVPARQRRIEKPEISACAASGDVAG